MREGQMKPKGDPAMPKFCISAQMTISVSTVVEASTEEEAIEIAKGRPNQGFCHQCGGNEDVDQEWQVGGDLDGDPVNLRAERIGEQEHS